MKPTRLPELLNHPESKEIVNSVCVRILVSEEQHQEQHLLHVLILLKGPIEGDLSFSPTAESARA